MSVNKHGENSNNGTVDEQFWHNKSVFLTGHTGFKGSWLSIWLSSMGAKVTGYSLEPPTSPSLFAMANVDSILEKSVIGDIRNHKLLEEQMRAAQPEIIIHMAAQPLVRASYIDPVYTYQTNVMGTVHLMEAARQCDTVRVILNVTTDKCYENKEQYKGYSEGDPLGGYDPYSSSKACSELITSAYYRSYFQLLNVGVATARAGNVFGGGDWAKDRLIPDIITALMEGRNAAIRNPQSTRPWQHVLEPLSGYLILCQQLYADEKSFAEPFNFGPSTEEIKSVEWITQTLIEKWPHKKISYEVVEEQAAHEAEILMLDSSKAFQLLNWSSRWSVEQALEATLEWYLGMKEGKQILELCRGQIAMYSLTKIR